MKEIVKDHYKGTTITKSQITSEGAHCIRYGEIYTTYDIWFDNPISRIQLEEGKRYKYCEKGDLLVTDVSQTFSSVGKPLAYVGDSPVVLGNHIILLKHSQNSKYLAYALSNKSVEKQKRRLCQGTTVTEIGIDALLEIKIPLPPLKKQEKIAKWLDTFISLERQLERQKVRYQYYLNKLTQGGAIN